MGNQFKITVIATGFENGKPLPLEEKNVSEVKEEADDTEIEIPTIFNRDAIDVDINLDDVIFDEDEDDDADRPSFLIRR